MILCKLGIHLPIQYSDTKILFYDAISGNPVLQGKCPCGQRWMVELEKNFPLYKVKL